MKKSHVRNFSGKASREKISREKFFCGGFAPEKAAGALNGDYWFAGASEAWAPCAHAYI